MDTRRSKENYYLDIADAVLNRSTCLRRKYGAIVVHNDEILSTGYNGAPRGRKNCTAIGMCTRDELGIPSGQRYELCRSVHAEANAIISAARRDMIGGKTGGAFADHVRMLAQGEIEVGHWHLSCAAP